MLIDLLYFLEITMYNFFNYVWISSLYERGLEISDEDIGGANEYLHSKANGMVFQVIMNLSQINYIIIESMPTYSRIRLKHPKLALNIRKMSRGVLS